MARYHPKDCWRCGLHVDATGHISATGLCPKCSIERETENLLGMQAKEGPAFEHWARRSLMAMHRALVANKQDAA